MAPDDQQQAIAHPADPGGTLPSDTHRRVLGHLPHLHEDEPMDLHILGHRISSDPHHVLSHLDEVTAVLKELEADGLAKETEKEGRSRWKMTAAGLKAITAPAIIPEGTLAGPAILGGLEPLAVAKQAAS